MYKRGLIALKQQKMSDQKKKKRREIGHSTDRRCWLFVFRAGLGWGGVGGRSLVLVVAHY